MAPKCPKHDFSEARQRRFKNMAAQGYCREDLSRSFGVHGNVIDRWAKELGVVLKKGNRT